MLRWVKVVHYPFLMTAATWLLIACSALLGLSYGVFEPARVTAPGTVSIVAYVEKLGPVWVISFSVNALVLATCAVLKRGVRFGHVLSGSIMSGYAMALVLGSVLSDPPRPPVTGVLAAAVVGFHLLMAGAYSQYAHQLRGGHHGT